MKACDKGYNRVVQQLIAAGAEVCASIAIADIQRLRWLSALDIQRSSNATSKGLPQQRNHVSMQS